MTRPANAKKNPPSDGSKKDEEPTESVSYTAYGVAAGGPPPSFTDPSLPGGAESVAAGASATPTKAGEKGADDKAASQASPYASPWKMAAVYPGSPWGTDGNGMPPPYPPPPPGYPAYAGHAPQYWGPRPPIAMLPGARMPGGIKLPTKALPEDRRGAASPSEIDDLQRKDVQHMGCTCKKTRCLKMYCQCFAVQVDCQSSICRCLDCHNLPAHDAERTQARQVILQRNPQAFTTKFHKDESQLSHKLGCKCRKSGCMKKYCECFAGGVSCNNHCRCMGCKNSGGAIFSDPGAAGSFFGGIFPSPAQVLRQAGDSKPAALPYTAAQNLTSLKNASSPNSDEPKGKKARPDPEQEAMDSLMMAAYAMTEFGQGSSPSKARVPPKKAAEDAAKIATAPTPKKLHQTAI